MQVVILAGGVAARMRPLSDELPKSLFPVAGRPFLDWQLELLRRGGATRALLCVSHFAGAIRAHVERSPPPLAVRFSEDGAQPAGTGGALAAAQREGLLDERFLVTYGDSYLPIDLAPLLLAHLAAGTPATMAVHHNRDRWDASNVVVESGRVVHYEKIHAARLRPPEMSFIDYGLSVLERDEVARWSDAAPFDLSAPIGRLVAAGQLAAHEVGERFYEIGSPAGLRELEERLSARQEVRR